MKYTSYNVTFVWMIFLLKFESRHKTSTRHASKQVTSYRLQDTAKRHSPDGVAGGILLKHSDRNRYRVAALLGLLRHNVILSGHRTLLNFCFRELWRGSLSLRAGVRMLPAPGLLQAALSLGENWNQHEACFLKRINHSVCFMYPEYCCRIKFNITHTGLKWFSLSPVTSPYNPVFCHFSIFNFSLFFISKSIYTFCYHSTSHNFQWHICDLFHSEC
jgi:hypothetical protein